ncbi:RNA 2'-phosphotransferase [Corticibacterium sp. UT-5YL-CI-8]|nr:RNA 2'-phosphotransferase [Tianweitania sp. UT-5YL-CI-8]
MPSDTTVSKFMSLVLRHEPQQAGLQLDENGWTDFEILCAVLEKRFGASRKDVLRIVAENPKKRFTLEGSRIRAAQGHSIEVDLKLTPAQPPETLYHGTKTSLLGIILTEGLTRQSRQHVHLSPDIETAAIVGNRRKGETTILKIAAQRMAFEGMVFYLSENGVWLVDHVPPQYLSYENETVTS